MKKIYVLFSSVVAILFFMILWNNFSFSYIGSFQYLDFNQIKEDNVKSYEFLISNHFLESKDSDSLIDSIIDLVKYNELNSYVSVATTDDHGREKTVIYSNLSSRASYSHLNIVENIDDFIYSEVNYLTSDPNDELENALHIEPLGSNLNIINSASVNNIIEIKKFNNIKELKTTNYVGQISINVTTDEANIARIRNEIINNLYQPYNLCSDSDCSSFIGHDSSAAVRILDNKRKLDMLSDFISMPKPLLYIFMIIYICVQVIYTKNQEKEIAIRQLNGQRTIKIYMDLCLPNLLIGLLSFFGTLIVMFLLFINRYNSIILQFISIIFKSTFIYFLVTLFLSGLLFHFISIKSYSEKIKSTFSNSFLDFLINISKSICMVILILSLTISITNIGALHNHISNMKNDNLFTNSYKIDNPIQFIQGSESTELETLWTIEASSKLSKIIKEYDINVVSHSLFLIPEISDNIPVLIINDKLASESLDKKYTDEFDNSILNENYFIVPKTLTNSLNPELNHVIVEKAPKFVTSDLRLNSMQEENEYLTLVMVDDYNLFDLKSFELCISEINLKKNELNILDISNKISSEIASTSIFHQEDTINLFEIQYKLEFLKIILEIAIMVFVFFLVDLTRITTFLVNNSKELMVKYQNGINRCNRYMFLVLTQLTSNVLVFMFASIIMMRNKHLLIKKNFPLKTLLILSIIMVIIDVYLLVCSIRKFERKGASSMLKGGKYV